MRAAPPAATRPTFDVSTIWEQYGVTEHPGGESATRRLIERCGVPPRARVLDAGCGTGYSACLLAEAYCLNVTAADLRMAVLERAAARVGSRGLGGQVKLVAADLRGLPFVAGAFDAALSESVLLHCDKGRAVAELFRVLAPGGWLACNELTYLAPPPPDLKRLESTAFGTGFAPHLRGDWEALFEAAGFRLRSSEIERLSVRGQLASHIRVDGWRVYLRALALGLSDPTVYPTFFTRDMLRGWAQYADYVGYGLYVLQKPR